MESSIMPYTTESNRLIALMLDESIPRNQSTCKDCSLYVPTNNYHGSCAHQSIALAHDPSCYQAKIQPSSAVVKEPSETHYQADQLTQTEAHLDDFEAPDSYEEPDYTLGTPTDETLDELAAALDLEELADLSQAINEYLQLNDRADTTASDRKQQLLKLQRLLASASSDMGLLKFTTELYERLYGQQSA